MKTPVNNAAVDTANETNINNNHKSRNELCFKKKNIQNEKKVIIFCEIFSQELFTCAKIGVE